jgi:hypothetical protein
LQPMVHYIPLRKDFSNLDEVLMLFRDPQVRRELTQNAHRDLIASGRYSYERFIERFDEDLIEAEITPEVSASDAAIVERAVDHARRRRAVKVQLRWISQITVVMYVLLNLFKLTGFLRRRARSLRHRFGHAQR